MSVRGAIAPRRGAAISAAFVGAYVALDWASYIHPVADLAITPWNPPPGLSLFLLLRYGLRYTPLLLVAAIAGDLVVRGIPTQPVLAVASSVLIATGYAAVGALLVGPLGVGRRLANLRDVNRFVSTAVLAPVPIGLAYVGLHTLLGKLPAADFGAAALQFWIGDAIGIIVTTPLLLEYAERKPLARGSIDVELVLQGVAVALALWIVFGLQATDEFKFFYLLFLPLVWIAMRRGFRGAVVASVAIQLGVVAAVGLGATSVPLRELQFLMLALALTALYLGMTVTEREAARRAVAARDAALNRALRMATAGELAAAIAHELNQPLSAIGTYARACVHLAGQGTCPPLLSDTLAKIDREVKRAGEVIRRLRAFYRTGSMRRERVEPAALVAAAVESLASRLAQAGVEVEVDRATNLRAIYVDRIQMQAVLHNLVANAIDALSAGAPPRPRIAICLAAGPNELRCEVSDNGPGIAGDVAARLFQPFITTRADGMGLGLAMSRSIVEAHGGTLECVATAPDAAARLTTFRLTLPFAPSDESAGDA
jgi:signal transduction histidine kinase